MKRQDPKEPKQATTTSAELEKQAAELARRLTELEAEERSLDGLADFERVAVIAGQRSAFAKALDLANERIAETRKAEKQAAMAAAEVAKTERKLAAIGAARSEVRSLASVLMHLDQSVLSSFDAALAELYAAGAWMTSEVATIAGFRQRVAGTLEALGGIDPTLIGKPPKPSAKEIQLAEARRDLARAEAHLSELAKVRYGGSDERTRALEAAGAWLSRSQKHMSALTGESFVLANVQQRIANLSRFSPAPPAESEVMT